MLTLNISYIQTLLLQIIMCFVFDISEEYEDPIDVFLDGEVEKFFLISPVSQQFLTKKAAKDIFLKSKRGFVFMGSFDHVVMRPCLLNKVLSDAVFQAWIRTGPNKETLIKNIDRGFTRSKENDRFFIMISLNMFNLLFNYIDIHDNAEIHIVMKKPSGETLHLLSILSIDRKNVKISRPGVSFNPSIIKSSIEQNLSFYYQNYANYLIYSIEVLKEQIDITNKIILISNRKIIFHIDESPIVMLYSTHNIPSFDFFGDFSIKLKPLEEKDYGNKQVFGFKYEPSIFLEFSQINNNSDNKFKLQIMHYIYSDDCGVYFPEHASRFCMSLCFTDGSVTTDQRDDAHVFITFDITRNNNFDVILYFYKKILKYDLYKYFILWNAIDHITIQIFGGSSVTLDTRHFMKSDNNSRFEIKFSITPASIVNGFTLYNILKERDGIFSITMKSKNKTIIENKICLSGEDRDMLVLSSTRLESYILCNESKDNDNICSDISKDTRESYTKQQNLSNCGAFESKKGQNLKENSLDSSLYNNEKSKNKYRSLLEFLSDIKIDFQGSTSFQEEAAKELPSTNSPQNNALFIDSNEKSKPLMPSYISEKDKFDCIPVEKTYLTTSDSISTNPIEKEGHEKNLESNNKEMSTNLKYPNTDNTNLVTNNTESSINLESESTNNTVLVSNNTETPLKLEREYTDNLNLNNVESLINSECTSTKNTDSFSNNVASSINSECTSTKITDLNLVNRESSIKSECKSANNIYSDSINKESSLITQKTSKNDIYLDSMNKNLLIDSESHFNNFVDLNSINKESSTDSAHGFKKSIDLDSINKESSINTKYEIKKDIYLNTNNTDTLINGEQHSINKTDCDLNNRESSTHSENSFENNDGKPNGNILGFIFLIILAGVVIWVIVYFSK